MDWQKFFHLTVTTESYGLESIFFDAQLSLNGEFAHHDLILPRFEYLNLSQNEKKKFSLGVRKIILSHDVFRSEEFKKSYKSFKRKILKNNSQEITFFTQGGGIYLFLCLLNEEKELGNKQITCYSSEIPLPIFSCRKNKHIQFIFRPQNLSYLSDFSSLWKNSGVMSLFELNDFETAA
jgi:hypothetical protein